MSDGFICYWDESGTDPGTKAVARTKNPYLVVAGYMSNTEEWGRFAEDWEALLRRHQLSRFHMSAFCNLQFPYSQWTQGERDDFITAAFTLIRKHTRIRIAYSLSIDDYMTVIKSRNLINEDFIRAYHILAYACIRYVSAAARTAGYAQKILHIFDKGNAAWPSFQTMIGDQMLEANNILRPMAQRSEDVLPLQAADILAHQTARVHRKGIPSQRLYYNELMKKPGFVKRLDARDLLTEYREHLHMERTQKMGPWLGRKLALVQTSYIPSHQLRAAAEIFSSAKEYSGDERVGAIQRQHGEDPES